jgi:undecaprenyl-diphosphatase
MSIWMAIVLGIVQGLTEFLPVSSSGHLELSKALMGTESMPKESMMMTVVLHAATALSTVVVFRKDILEIGRGLLSFQWNEEAVFSIKIIISMIPAAIVGVGFNDQIEELFAGQILLVGLMLLLTGGLLFVADRAQHTEKKVGYKEAIWVGIAQAIAILPGISRSGATISTSVLLGVDREKAARFSFLMVIPLIFGKIGKDMLSGDFTAQADALPALGVGFIAAFCTGLVACTWMIRLVKQSKLSYFAYYCFIVGIFSIASTII